MRVFRLHLDSSESGDDENKLHQGEGLRGARVEGRRAAFSVSDPAVETLESNSERSKTIEIRSALDAAGRARCYNLERFESGSGPGSDQMGNFGLQFRNP